MKHSGGDEDATTREHIALQIPTSRKALADWYYASRNKRFIYWLSLALWTIVFAFMMTIVPLTATNTYRVTFYVPLFIFIVLFPLSTHWLIQCALNDYATREDHSNGASHFVINSNGETFV